MARNDRLRCMLRHCEERSDVAIHKKRRPVSRTSLYHKFNSTYFFAAGFAAAGFFAVVAFLAAGFFAAGFFAAGLAFALITA